MRERVLTNLFNIACTIFFALLFFYSFIMTGYVPLDLSTELISFRSDNILFNILGLTGGASIFAGLYWIGDKYKLKVNTRILAMAASVLAMAISLYWIVSANVVPEADQWNVSFYAKIFNEGDFSGFEKGKYIATCPHQLGIVTLLRIIYSVLGPYRYAGFRIISAISVGIIVYVGYELVRRFSEHNSFAEMVYLLLSVSCFPMYVYTLFIYGEVSSTAVLFIGAWLLLSCMDHFHWSKAIGLLLCSGLSVQLRQNSLIVLIGFMVVLAVKLLQKFHWQKVLLLIVIPAGIVAGNLAIKGIYREHFIEDAKAIPNIMYITMGTTWDEQNPGWFNGYNYDVFFENDCDVEKASQVAKEDLKDFISYCIQNPAYALEFYEQKFIAQWNEPMYHSLVMNCKVNEGEPQDPIIEKFYFGELRVFTEGFMNIYQLIVYGSILAWLILNLKKQQGIEIHVLMVGIFGGFLFSLLWEAKTRYVFPYFIMMLPYAALGMNQIVMRIYHKIKK